MAREFTDQELKEYAHELIYNHAFDIEWLSIHEMADEALGTDTLSREDALRVDELIRSAVVDVSWDD